VLQVESVNERECELPVGRYEENQLVIEAYNDPHLQPVVLMHRLNQSQYVL